jgi:ATP synthase F1 complex assembly factor 1/histone-lysine N-methyltransferase SETD2
MLRSASSRLLLLQLAARRGGADALASAAAAATCSSSIHSSSSSSSQSGSGGRHDDHFPQRRRHDCSGAIGGVGVVGVGALRSFGSSAAPQFAAFTMPSPTQLDAVMRMETLVDRTADEIEDIWMEYHGGDAAAAATTTSGSDAAAAPQPPSPPPAGDHCVGTVLSAEEYKVLSARAKASPMFVLPLRKTVVKRRKQQEQGEEGGAAAAAAAADADASSSSSSPPAYLTLLLQWQLPLLLVTTVDEYRRLGPNAPPHLVATFYPQLADSKGIVLARADLTGPGGGKGSGAGSGAAVASRAEARTVLELARAFYTDGEMHRLAYTFNHEQQAFDFNELLRALGLEGAAPVAAAE